MASLINRFTNSVSNSSYQPKLGSLRDQVGDFVASVQEDLGVLDELRYEWRRLQTFVDWPLDLPRPSELAKAGFFFTPTEDTPDRCAHFCTDKFFSAWEAGDDPWEVLRDNCPECPFVLGSSNNVPLPSAYVPHVEGEGLPEANRRAASDLGSYLTQAVQRVAAAAGSSATVASAAAAAAAGGAGAAGFGELRTEGALKVTSKAKKKGKRGGKGGAARVTPPSYPIPKPENPSYHIPKPENPSYHIPKPENPSFPIPKPENPTLSYPETRTRTSKPESKPETLKPSA